MKRLFIIALFLVSVASIAFGQPRPADKSANPNAKQSAPTVAAKYEGGLFGFTQKIEGSLKFDEGNDRLIFVDKTQKEMFSLPYDSLNVIYPSSQSVTSTAGSIISHVPLPGAGLAGLLKEKRRYMVLQFDDPDADAKGSISFRIENKETLDSLILTLGTKAKLTSRGDAYYRPRQKPSI